MLASTANHRTYIYLYLDGMIHGSVFEKIAPLLDKKYEYLAKSLCKLFQEGKEINSENIYLAHKDANALAQYMEIVNDIDRKKLPSKKRDMETEVDMDSPENRRIEEKRLAMINVLECVSGKSLKELLIEGMNAQRPNQRT